ncbi:MAG: hypothetical protein JWN49_133 [Parcubacteria group bacterium]|nr:hypothetical protein [Parcubacteria group bacterium]
MKRTYTSLAIILLVLIVAVVAYMLYPVKQNEPAVITPSGAVAYTCDSGKTFTATFSDTDVALTLSDGRSLTLPHVMSGSGIRYEQGNVVLVGKGSDAFIEENGAQTYVNCVVNAAAPVTTTTTTNTTFTDQGHTFSFSYPSDFTASGAGIGYTQEWMSNATTTGLVLAKLTLPRSFQSSTNFSEAKLTVGTSADAAAVASCLTDTTGTSVSKSTVTINGTTYTKFVGSDAGAGNLYQTTSYHTKRNSQCYVVEYTIHSTNIGNYSPDQGIKEYDSVKVNALLDSVVQSFKFL